MSRSRRWSGLSSYRALPPPAWYAKSTASVARIVVKTALDRIHNYVQIGKKEGARALVGAEIANVNGKGFFYSPTLLEGVQPGATLEREEVFGPVLAAMRFASEDDALHLANETEYGLAAYVWTSDAGRLIRMTDAIDAGVVLGNSPLVMDSGLPFGGFKGSGLGGAFGMDAIEGCTRTKRVTIRTAADPLPAQWEGV